MQFANFEKIAQYQPPIISLIALYTNGSMNFLGDFLCFLFGWAPWLSNFKLLMTFQWYGWNGSNYEIKAQKLMFEMKNMWLTIVINLFMCLWVCVKPTKLSPLQPSMPTYLPLSLLQDIVLHAIDKLYLPPSLRSRLHTIPNSMPVNWNMWKLDNFFQSYPWSYIIRTWGKMLSNVPKSNHVSYCFEVINQ